VPRVSSEIADDCIEAALALTDIAARAETLAVLAPKVSSERMPWVLHVVLEATSKVSNEWRLSEIFALLGPQLTGDLRERGLEIARTIKDDYKRALAVSASALAALAPRLAPDQQRQAIEQGFEAAQQLRDSFSSAYSVAQALSALVPYFAADQIQRALDAAERIWDASAQADVLAVLAPRLPENLIERCLKDALKLSDGYSSRNNPDLRAKVLIALAPKLAGDLLQRAFDAARWLGQPLRTRTIIALAGRLPGVQQIQILKQALRDVLAIPDTRLRAETLPSLLTLTEDQAAILMAIRATITDALMDSQGLNREAMLRLCANKELFTVPQLRADTIVTIAEHIVEICQEWQWL
jgi:inorganic triphosphatase YgiF